MEKPKVFKCYDEKIDQPLVDAVKLLYEDIKKQEKGYVAVFFHRDLRSEEKGLFAQIVHGHHLETELPILTEGVPPEYWQDVRNNLKMFQQDTHAKAESPSTFDKSKLALLDDLGYIFTDGREYTLFGDAFPCESVDTEKKDEANWTHLKNYFSEAIKLLLKVTNAFQEKPFSKIPFCILSYNAFPKETGAKPRNYVTISSLCYDQSRPQRLLYFKRLRCESFVHLKDWEPKVRQLLTSDYLPDIFYGYVEILLMLKDQSEIELLGNSREDPKTGPDRTRQERLRELFVEFFPRHLRLDILAFYHVFWEILIVPLRLVGTLTLDQRIVDTCMENYAIDTEFRDLLKSRLTVGDLDFLENLAKETPTADTLLANILIPQIYPKRAKEIYQRWFSRDKSSFIKGFPEEIGEIFYYAEPATIRNLIDILVVEHTDNFREILVKKYLRDKDPATRALAVLCLAHACVAGRIQKIDVMDVDFLFYDQSGFVKRTILKNITKICEPNFYVYEGVESLCHDPDIALLALEKYLELRGPTANALKLLIPYMEEGETSDPARKGNFLFWWFYCVEKAEEACDEECLEVILSMLDNPRLRRHAITAMVWVGRPEHLPRLKKLVPYVNEYEMEWLRRAIQTLGGDSEGLWEDFKKIRAHGMIKGFISHRIIQPASKRAKKIKKALQSDP